MEVPARQRATYAKGSLMAGFDDIVGKAHAFLEDEKVQSKLHSSQVEEVSDKILKAAEDAVNTVTGNKFAAQVASAKNAADKAVGTKEPADHAAGAKLAGAKAADGESAASKVADSEPAAGSNLRGDLAPSTEADDEK